MNWDTDVVAFAVGELGLRLEEFFDMPWCEFLLKSYAYHRQEKDRMRHTKLIAYHAMVGSHLDPKKLPSARKFFGEGGKEGKAGGSRVSDEAKALFRKRMREWKEKTGYEEKNNKTPTS